MDANNAQTNENESQQTMPPVVFETEGFFVRDRDEQLDRIERKLDMLIEALAAEDEQEPEACTLDGEEAGGERDQSQPL